MTAGRIVPVTFPSGELRLEGLLYAPEGPPTGPAVAACHPHPLYGGDMRNAFLVALCRAAEGLGRPVLRFNFRGTGRSEGVHGDGVGEADDVRAAVDFLAGRFGGEVDLLGYSFGAWMALAAGSADPRVRRIAAVAVPLGVFDPGDAGRGGKPRLVVAGGRDEFAPIGAVRAWFASLDEPKGLREIPSADHFFAFGAAEAARAVGEFLA